MGHVWLMDDHFVLQNIYKNTKTKDQVWLLRRDLNSYTLCNTFYLA